MSSARRRVGSAVAALAATAALAGCAGEEDEPWSSCELMSQESIIEVIGTSKDVFAFGSHEPPPRVKSSCTLGTRGSATTTMAELDALDRREGYSPPDEVLEELRDRQQQADGGEGPSCTDVTALPEDRGYLCHGGADQKDTAAVGLPDRLVRFTFHQRSQWENVTPENVQAWAEEVDRNIRELDQEADGS